MAEEMLDLLDEQGQIVGQATRTEVHRRGWWHRTFHCWLLERHETELSILIQQRHESKEASPGLWDITAAGHLEAGEEPLKGLRELEEELGLQLMPADLHPIGILPVEMEMGEGRMDREFCHLFLAWSPLSMERFRLCDGEVSAICRVSLAEAEELLEGKRERIGGEGWRLASDGSMAAVSVQLSRQDWVPHGLAYYRHVFRSARRWAMQQSGMEEVNR
ncbi:NUDIX hydrolase [Desmospora profundinema]|uniref:Isopentenyldiphosphate isomerase n=1 Tax=Desmospora profundinema TaxID=1571184 RepID=A0ABU1IQ35_9BACL|nr:NUDIX domain-containing protein [Desmospora profundinema]MDR6226895.1 isopentenyldiphosphate isomerase [Desmospora profundinema]